MAETEISIVLGSFLQMPTVRAGPGQSQESKTQSSQGGHQKNQDSNPGLAMQDAGGPTPDTTTPI